MDFIENDRRALLWAIGKSEIADIKPERNMTPCVGGKSTVSAGKS